MEANNRGLDYISVSISGTWWRGWFRHYATRRKAAGSIPDGSIWILQSFRPHYGLGGRLSLEHKSVSGVSPAEEERGKGGRCVRLTTLPLSLAYFVEIL